MTKTAFVIVCWNNEKLLEDCLDSIEKQTNKNHITILLDNNSSDGSVSFVKTNYKNVTLIESEKNFGFAKGNNIAIKKALEDQDVEYIALLNTDARIEKDWLEKITKFAECKPNSACLQGTTLDYYDHSIIDSTHIFLSRNGQATQANWREKYFGEFGPKKVFGVNAAACVITRSFIEAQPFGDEIFDETMFMYLEDVDLAVRSTIMGWDNYLVPGARAYHMGSASSGKKPGFSLYMTFRNNSALVYKNMPVKFILKMLIPTIRSDFHTYRHLRRQGMTESAYVLYKGRIVGLFRVLLFTKKRAVMARHRTIDYNYLWWLMNSGR